ncbi:mitochondrial carrier domain-containing protein [Fusarium flagelliforme]|uniref:mitochondrial carrier domain-containing protein n=1 Tax=Fusarium flagelliforme TaxID=2675880 RepID=UPI001E8E8898|nr:mitochondrial carrier domain-containing protein [Fusarium flagelliforme]KAH7169670.1 mitochondrial carrier domain-containing protein [Fusarium flagelliforme]
MPSKRHEPSSGSSQGAEKGRTGIHEHDKRPHEPAPRLSHLEHLTVRVSDNSIRSLAGATSAIASSIVTSPLDVMKIKLQGRGGLQLWTLDSVRKRRSFQERGLIGTGRAIWHEGGFIGIKSPLLSILSKIWRVVLTSAKRPTIDVGMLKHICSYWRYFFYIIHESIIGYQNQTHISRIQVCHRRSSEDIYLTGSGLGNWHEGQEWLQILGVLTASVASKACATIATYPHEVVRTRLQTQQKVYLSSPIEHARARDGGGLLMRGSSSQSEKVCNAGKIWERFPRLNWGVMSTLEMISREEGWRALYSGMGTSLIGAIPASAMTMLVYEAVVWQIKKSRTQGKRKLEMQDIPVHTTR